MSVDTSEPDDRLWEAYLTDLEIQSRESGRKYWPSSEDFDVWKQDHDIDEKEYEAPDDYER